jgi:hypothetical protein
MDLSTFDTLQESDEKAIIIQGLVFIDIISRILGLTDLVTNSGNFYFICDTSQHISGFKVIDFGIGRIISGTVFKGFLEGNGIYQFKNSRDPLIRYFLAEGTDTRVKRAQAVFLPKRDDAIRAIRCAFG